MLAVTILYNNNGLYKKNVFQWAWVS